MSITEALRKRRSIYHLDKNIPVDDDTLAKLIKEITELVPDAFNMKSQRVVLALGEKQDILWETIFEAFDGKVEREKINGFKAGHGSVLYFYDSDVVREHQVQFPRYAENFPIWAQQANGMLQISIWSALREIGIGANIQHYNPVIDEAVKKLFDVPESWILVAQMPFGGICAEPDAKAKENIDDRVKVLQ